MPPRTYVPQHRRSRGSALFWGTVNLVGSLVLVALGVWIFTAQTDVREAEAFVSAKLLARLMGTTAEPLSHGTFRFGTGFDTRALRITGECSIGPLVGIVLIATGALTAARGRLARSFFVAGAAAVGVITGANLLRIVLISWAFRSWGYRGYELTHIYVGSVLIIVATGFALMLYLSLAGFRSRTPKKQRRPRDRQQLPAG